MIYLLITFSDDNYSYLGVSENEYHAFSTYEKATAFADANSLDIRCTAESESDCVIEKITFDQMTDKAP